MYNADGKKQKPKPLPPRHTDNPEMAQRRAQILKRFKMQNQMQLLENLMFVIMVEPHLATKVILLH